MNQLPDISLVMPCYNEEEALPLSIPPLVEVFAKEGVSLELVLVDNGSGDQTSAVIDGFIALGLPVVKAVVPVNQGFGFGILTGFTKCTGRYAGYLCADGQVKAEDVLRIYRAAAGSAAPAMAKVRRRFRQDSWIRKLISVFYNGIMLVLFPGISTLDVNGNPKIVSAEVLKWIAPSSHDWFLDAEFMLKARHLKLNVIEINVPGQLRQAGKSNVRMRTVVEFVKNILRARFGKDWTSWAANVSLSFIQPPSGLPLDKVEEPVTETSSR
jgi:glycosyltransferase involved in cell wall biosynthesis